MGIAKTIMYIGLIGSMAVGGIAAGTIYNKEISQYLPGKAQETIFAKAPIKKVEKPELEKKIFKKKVYVEPRTFADYEPNKLQDEIISLRKQLNSRSKKVYELEIDDPILKGIIKLVGANDMRKYSEQIEDYTLYYLKEDKSQEFIMKKTLKHLPKYNLDMLLKLDEEVEKLIQQELPLEKRAIRRYNQCKESLQIFSDQALEGLEGKIKKQLEE